jgi:hypothetical protein
MLTGAHKRVSINALQRHEIRCECWIINSCRGRWRLEARVVFHDEFENARVTFSAGRMEAVAAEAEGGHLHSHLT